MKAWHEADMLNRMYVPLKDGKKIAMPRYYKDKIYTKEQRQHIGAYLSTAIVEKEFTEQEKINNFEVQQRKLNKARLKESF
jgi:hypothetical protein